MGDILPKKLSDYILHPPSGSSYPGKEIANPYIYYPPSRLRDLIAQEKDTQELTKMKSALKQWERLYVYPGYPYRLANKLRHIASQLLKLSEVRQPARNIPYYQESDIPTGPSNVLHMLRNVDDNYDLERFDYNRQGERPKRDIDTGKGNFLSPSEPIHNDGRGVVEPRGEGISPDIEYPFPPTGGDIDQWPDMI